MQEKTTGEPQTHSSPPCTLVRGYFRPLHWPPHPTGEQNGSLCLLGSVGVFGFFTHQLFHSAIARYNILIWLIFGRWHGACLAHTTEFHVKESFGNDFNVQGYPIVAGLGAVVLFAAGNARAANLVNNGGFETLTSGPGQLGFNTDATGWTTTGYNFVFAPGTADTTGATGQFGNFQLSGTRQRFSQRPDRHQGPAGGNYLAARRRGSKSVRSPKQLMAWWRATNMSVSFYWAGAQQSGSPGATTEQFSVSLGSETQSTAVIHNVGEGFTGWKLQSFTFTADGTSDLLSFLAVGTPAGVPPFSLLDGVTLNAVTTAPEPASLALLGAGLVGLGGIVRRTRANGGRAQG